MGKVEARYTRSHVVRLRPYLQDTRERGGARFEITYIHCGCMLVVAVSRRIVASSRSPVGIRKAKRILEFEYSVKNCLPPCVGADSCVPTSNSRLLFPLPLTRRPIKVRQNESG